MRVLEEAKKRLLAFGFIDAVVVASVLEEISAEELL